MSVASIKNNFGALADTLFEESVRIVEVSANGEEAQKKVLEHISNTIAAKSRGYIASVYTSLMEETLELPEFKDNIDEQNKLFNLKLEDKIINAYNFNVDTSLAFHAGIDFKEINRAYASAAAAVGTTAVGGILLGILSGAVHIPVAVVIAGAALCGLGGGAATYEKIVPAKNSERFKSSLRHFLSLLEAELRNWVDGIVEFFHEEVAALKEGM